MWDEDDNERVFELNIKDSGAGDEDILQFGRGRNSGTEGEWSTNDYDMDHGTAYSIIVTWDQSEKTLVIYTYNASGTLVDTHSPAAFTCTDDCSFDTTPIILGTTFDSDVADGDYGNYSVEKVALFNKVLTSAERAALVAGTLSSPAIAPTAIVYAGYE